MIKVEENVTAKETSVCTVTNYRKAVNTDRRPRTEPVEFIACVLETETRDIN